MGNGKFVRFPVLYTENLVLRQLLPGDDKQIFALRSDDRVNKYLDRKPSKSIADAKRFIAGINENSPNKDSFYWAIALKSTNQLIGTICLFGISDDDQKAAIGFELLPDYQGRGIMREAISEILDFAQQEIGLIRIEACTAPENLASQRLLEKFNFKKQNTSGSKLWLFQWTVHHQGKRRLDT
ncbi:MAG TPA: GNAT family N-acetyltransferase [Sediminibacterium sp.]|nr:GNAT family N-acetyltransferase [Sediminibacterium sp.]